jgi:integrase
MHAREPARAGVNKHRQVLSAIFNFGLRPGHAERWRLTSNPAAAATKRREPPAARLEVFTVEQIEALVRSAESGAWRGPHDDLTDAGGLLRAEEDAQFGELLRIAAYTGLRRGELVALRWHDVRWSERVLVVERALSGDVEGTTKGGRVRYVPLGDQALGALDRLSRRRSFTAAGDYVFATIAGDRPDPSALRRRFIAARDAAGLPLRFHDLRHTAGTLLTRVLDPVTVRDVLGHADLKTTERYLHAVRASRLSDAATRAFTIEPSPDRGPTPHRDLHVLERRPPRATAPPRSLRRPRCVNRLRRQPDRGPGSFMKLAAGERSEQSGRLWDVRAAVRSSGGQPGRSRGNVGAR